jgi:hypothetical protein
VAEAYQIEEEKESPVKNARFLVGVGGLFGICLFQLH